MNKRILTVFLSILALFPLAAADPFSGYPSGVSGDYVVYRDYSWEKPTWVGLLYYDDSTWGAFVSTPSTNSRVSLLFSTEKSAGKLVLTGQKIISNITPDDVLAVNYLMRLLPEMYAWRNTEAGNPAAPVVPLSADDARKLFGKARSALLPAAARESRTEPSFGGDVSVLFAPEIPVFNVRGILGSNGKPVLDIDRYGRISSGGDNAFFSFTVAGEAKSGESLVLAAGRKPAAKTIDGVTLKLDDQWAPIAENSFLLGNAAFVIVDTIDLSLTQIPRDNLALSLVRFFSLSGTESWVVPAELSVTGTAKRFTITNLVFDSARGTLNRDIKTCIPSADGKTVTVVSLSVSETAWKANGQYFSSLVQ
jgi:hypothetical protein